MAYCSGGETRPGAPVTYPALLAMIVIGIALGFAANALISAGFK